MSHFDKRNQKFPLFGFLTILHFVLPFFFGLRLSGSWITDAVESGSTAVFCYR